MLEPTIRWKTSTKPDIDIDTLLLKHKHRYMCYLCYHKFLLWDFLDREVICCPNCKRADWYVPVIIYKYRYETILLELIHTASKGG